MQQVRGAAGERITWRLVEPRGLGPLGGVRTEESAAGRGRAAGFLGETTPFVLSSSSALCGGYDVCQGKSNPCGHQRGWQGLVAGGHITAGLDQSHCFSNCVPEDTLENAERPRLRKVTRSSVRTGLTAPAARPPPPHLRHSAAKPSALDFTNNPTLLKRECPANNNDRNLFWGNFSDPPNSSSVRF